MLSRVFRGPRCNFRQGALFKREGVLAKRYSTIEKLFPKPIFSKSNFDPTPAELLSYNKQVLDQACAQFNSKRRDPSPLPLHTIEKYLKISAEARDFHFSCNLLQYLQDHSIPCSSLHYEFALMAGTKTLTDNEISYLFSRSLFHTRSYSPNYLRFERLVRAHESSHSPYFSPGFYTHLSQDLLQRRGYGALLSIYAHLQPFPITLEPLFLTSVLYAMQHEIHPEVDDLFEFLLANNQLPGKSFQDHLAYLVAIEEFSKFDRYLAIYQERYPPGQSFYASLLYLFLRKDKERAKKLLLELKEKEELGNHHLRICLAFLTDHPSYALNEAIMAMFPFTKQVMDYFYLICYHSVYSPESVKDVFEEYRENSLFIEKEVFLAFLWVYNDSRSEDIKHNLINIPLAHFEQFPPIQPNSLAAMLSFLPEVSKIMSFIEILSPEDPIAYKVTAAILTKHHKYNQTITLYDLVLQRNIPQEATLLRYYLTALLNHPLCFTLKTRVLDCLKVMRESNYDYYGYPPEFLIIIMNEFYEVCKGTEELKMRVKERVGLAFSVHMHNDGCSDYLRGNGFEVEYVVNFIKNWKFHKRKERVEKRRAARGA